MSDSPRAEERGGHAAAEERPRYSSPDDRGRSRSRSRDRRRSRSPRSPVDRRDRERDGAPGCVIYIAKLSSGTREADLRDGFKLFGEIKNIALKQRFAFITYEKPEEATEAIKKMHGAKFINGEELVVEQSVPGSRRKFNGPQKDDKCFKCNQTGHWANECRSRGSRRSRSRSYGRRHSQLLSYQPIIRRSRSRDRRYRSRSRSGGRRGEYPPKEGCFRCGKPGHFKRECPEMRGGYGGRRSSRSPYRGRDGDRRREERKHSRSRSRGGDRDHRERERDTRDRRRSYSRGSPNPER